MSAALGGSTHSFCASMITNTLSSVDAVLGAMPRCCRNALGMAREWNSGYEGMVRKDLIEESLRKVYIRKPIYDSLYEARPS